MEVCCKLPSLNSVGHWIHDHKMECISCEIVSSTPAPTDSSNVIASSNGLRLRCSQAEGDLSLIEAMNQTAYQIAFDSRFENRTLRISWVGTGIISFSPSSRPDR
jgi:hypothetical protein